MAGLGDEGGSVLPPSYPSSLASPGAIGGTTPDAGAFTTLSATGAATLGAGATVAGSAPSAAADQAQLGVADLNGATTAALRILNEGGGALLLRMMSASGAGKVAFYDEALADDASIALPTLTNGGFIIAAASPEGGIAHLASDGTVTILCGSANFVGTDTDAKLAIFDGGTAGTLRNRLGSSKRITALLIGS